MKIYLVRHGETDYNKIGRIQGRLPVPLNDNGHKQAQSIAKELKNLSATHLYSSPLTRAKQTAEYISKEIKLPIKFDELLVERHYGDWQNTMWEDVFKENPNVKKKWRRLGVKFAPPGGETVKEMIQRARRFVHKIKEEHTKITKEKVSLE